MSLHDWIEQTRPRWTLDPNPPRKTNIKDSDIPEVAEVFEVIGPPLESSESTTPNGSDLSQ